MLEPQGMGRTWITGLLDTRLGRGTNFQISVPALAPLLAALDAASHPLFLAPETCWYRIDDADAVVEQFPVADPDGHRLRFQTPLGRRAPR